MGTNSRNRGERKFLDNKTAEYQQQGFRSFCVYDIMSLDIISARSEAEWPSEPEASCDRRAIIR